MLAHRDNTEVVDVLDGIGLLQRSPVGWHLYQHLIRKAGIGLLLKLEAAEAGAPAVGGAGPLRFVVAALMDGGPARLTGEISVVSPPSPTCASACARVPGRCRRRAGARLGTPPPPSPSERTWAQGT
jgi:hypothetical protein